jgi:AraC-like DNA-binding protein
MAETRLTRGFKTLYGETIFSFSLKCRMQHALVLLSDRQRPVDVVSDEVGYRHSTSFATAFRRHYGFRPVDVKRVRVGESVGRPDSPSPAAMAVTAPFAHGDRTA